MDSMDEPEKPRSEDHAALPGTTQSPSACQLLRLPGELRNAICRLSLYHNNRIHVQNSQAGPYGTGFSPYPHQPALARTCRHLRSEVLSVFYGESTLVINYTSDCRKGINQWATVLRPSQQYFRRIEFTAGFTCTERDGSGKSERSIIASLTDDGCINVSATGFACVCIFERCARDLERSIIGDQGDSPLIRFLTAWDIPGMNAQTAVLHRCNGCSGSGVNAQIDSIVRSLALKGEEVTHGTSIRSPRLVLGTSK